MPHEPRPYFKAKRRTWYVEIHRKQHCLGEHPEGLPPPDKGKDRHWNPPAEIRQAFHKMMAAVANEEPAEAAAPANPPSPPFVSEVLDKFTAWLKARVVEGSKAPKTLAWYEKFLKSFLRFLASREVPVPAIPTLTIDQLTPAHVYDWADAQPGWKTGKRGAMTALQRAFNWAAKAGLLKAIGRHSPLAGLEKPAQGRREQLVSEPEYRELLSLVRDRPFADLLELAWNTGARPQELFTITAAGVDVPHERWVFPLKDSKGRKFQRVVYLNERALEITKRLVADHASGPLLLNTEARPWDVSSVKCRFQNLRYALGRKRLRKAGTLPATIKRLTAAEQADPKKRREHDRLVQARRELVQELAWAQGTRYSLYALRHSYCTAALADAGLDGVTVSQLMGHRSGTAMIARFYAHLDQRAGFLRNAARTARRA